MKRAIFFLGVAGLMILTGCALNTVKPISEVIYYPKPTSQEVLTKVNLFLSTHLIDPYSAKIACSEPTDEAWIWSGVGFETKYGYLVSCQVNSKNRFGGYVGAKQYIFRFNGSEFEYEDHTPRMGIMKK